ncbi:gamma-secretase subunit pen-2 [Ischnura elegans]|uniref:gamma-secretase subunit pen-2 n=1 Tax=Ischnura elegans TaxID=197161 RepID=UPI001ED892B9|nr:gamma-secretase subunit pen-2 [Ischnura elegans]
MDLSKLKNDKKLYLCKWYFQAGFLLLPFLWCVNAIWFFREAFWKPPYEEQKQIKKYVILSFIGALIWTIALVAWIVTFQTHRAEWGAVADRMSFIIPTGMP